LENIVLTIAISGLSDLRKILPKDAKSGMNNGKLNNNYKFQNCKMAAILKIVILSYFSQKLSNFDYILCTEQIETEAKIL